MSAMITARATHRINKVTKSGRNQIMTEGKGTFLRKISLIRRRGGFANSFAKFLWPFFVLKTPRNAMKHVINEREGHI